MAAKARPVIYCASLYVRKPDRRPQKPMSVGRQLILTHAPAIPACGVSAPRILKCMTPGRVACRTMPSSSKMNPIFRARELDRVSDGDAFGAEDE
jgi:hypothetical protein